MDKQKAPKILSYMYTGTNVDGACCLGVLGAVKPDGTAELWSREPNLGMVLQIVKADTLEIACPIHAMPHPATKKEYNDMLLIALNDFFDHVKQPPSCAEDIREIARLANYMADLWQFVDYGECVSGGTVWREGMIEKPNLFREPPMYSRDLICLKCDHCYFVVLEGGYPRPICEIDKVRYLNKTDCTDFTPDTRDHEGRWPL